MSEWKIHNPSRFPMLWSDVALRAVIELEKPQFLSQCSSPKAAKHLMREVRIWRYSLRNFGDRSHRAYRAETEYRLAVKSDEQDRVWITAYDRMTITFADPSILALLTPPSE